MRRIDLGSWCATILSLGVALVGCHLESQSVTGGSSSGGGSGSGGAGASSSGGAGSSSESASSSSAASSSSSSGADGALTTGKSCSGDLSCQGVDCCTS